MSLNKITGRLDRRMTNDIKTLKRNVRELKTPQANGADVIKVQTLPTSSFLNGGPLILAAGATGTFTINLHPANNILTLWNFLFSIAVDANDDVNNIFPFGPSLSAAQQNMRLYHWTDWANSNDTTNIRVIYVRVENYDVSPHNYYIFCRAYLPNNPGSST